jgi:hypothetical protein
MLLNATNVRIDTFNTISTNRSVGTKNIVPNPKNRKVPLILSEFSPSFFTKILSQPSRTILPKRARYEINMSRGRIKNI